MSQLFAGHGSTVGVGVDVGVNVGVGSSVGVGVGSFVGVTVTASDGFFVSSVGAEAVGVAFVSFFFVSFSVPHAAIVTIITKSNRTESSLFPLFTVFVPLNLPRKAGVILRADIVYRFKVTNH